MSNYELPIDFENRVYAGWLGKCIGVRFGAPLENWTYEEIRDNLGELTTYVSEDRTKIFKPDDDTAVPMILIHALEDYGASVDISSQQIGDTLVNYIGHEHGTFWWGGYGVSTEHTAYLNLINGISAPRSGSILQNGAALAEQIGGQIFSDIWGLIAPNNPSLAADLAEKASSVTHDGNGIYGGRFVAALVSAAFSETQARKLLEIALAQIPTESEFARVIYEMMNFHENHPNDWRSAFQHLKANFGYDRYSGAVHIIPNAGVIALGLLYGEGDFSRTLQITNMAGWDTDCNVGNVGTVVGITSGLDGIDAHWREPMNDLLISASLIGTRNILTIPQCVDLFIHLAKQLHKIPTKAELPRYHFNYGGSTQNFQARGQRGRPIHLLQAQQNDTPVLRTAIRKLNKKGEIRIFTRTYYRPNELSRNYYGAAFSPLIYPGQTITAKVSLPADAPRTVKAGLYVYDDNHEEAHQALATQLEPGQWHTLQYTIPRLNNACLSEVGIVLRNTGDLWEVGSFNLAELDWAGNADFETDFSYARNETGAISQWTYLRGYWRMEDGRFHGSGIGECEAYSGDIKWDNYHVTVELTPIIGDYHNVLFRVQGALRSYAFGLAADQTIRLYKKDRDYQIVQSAPFAWKHGDTYRLTVEVNGGQCTARIETEYDSSELQWFDETPYSTGQVGLGLKDGSHTIFHKLEVKPIAI